MTRATLQQLQLFVVKLQDTRTWVAALTSPSPVLQQAIQGHKPWLQDHCLHWMMFLES